MSFKDWGPGAPRIWLPRQEQERQAKRDKRTKRKQKMAVRWEQSGRKHRPEPKE